VYSCEPSCCFCHICVDCKTTFQTNTLELDGRVPNAVAPERERSSDEPHAPCTACDSIEVYALGTELVCTDCAQRLKLVIEDVEANA
jgi:hypothetical protein